MLEQIFPNYDRKYKNYLEEILKGRFKPMDQQIKQLLKRQFERAWLWVKINLFQL